MATPPHGPPPGPGKAGAEKRRRLGHRELQVGVAWASQCVSWRRATLPLAVAAWSKPNFSRFFQELGSTIHLTFQERIGGSCWSLVRLSAVRRSPTVCAERVSPHVLPGGKAELCSARHRAAGERTGGNPSSARRRWSGREARLHSADRRCGRGAWEGGLPKSARSGEPSSQSLRGASAGGVLEARSQPGGG